MGLFDLFRRRVGGGDSATSPGPPIPRALERNIKRLLNKHLHPEERWAAVRAVAEDPSEAAVDAMIRRFGVYVEPSAVDNEEKEYIADVLVGRGRIVVPQVERSMRRMDSITWQVSILGRILPRDALRDILIALAGEFDTEYERNPERKIQTIMALADFEGEGTAAAVVRFLDDVNETVRFQAVATLAAVRNDAAREPLVRTLLTEESVRVKNAILDLLVDTGWSVHGHRGSVEQILPKGYVIDRAGVVKKRPKGA